MWSPIDVFYIVWFFNFSPCQEARLDMNDFAKMREANLIKKIVQEKEDEIIKSTIGLRNDF